MVAILIVCVSLLSVNFAHGANLNVAQQDSILKSDVEGFVSNNLLIGLDLENIGQTSWLNTFNTFIPKWKDTTEKMSRIIKGLKNLIVTLKAQNSNPEPNDVVIPQAVLNANYKGINGLIDGYQNIVNANLNGVLEHYKTVAKIQNGNLIVPVSNGKVINLLQYISKQFIALGTGAAEYSVGLNLLSKAVSKYTKNDGEFEKFSVAVAAAGVQFNSMSADVANVANLLEQNVKVLPNGDHELSKDLLPALNLAAQRVGIYFDFISNHLEGFLNAVGVN